ncbi:uncharacterized protein LOC141904656 [Tubulanus polymorphus]|uniref:uncharacterized protein LOC141904656 n=1 Tax=Tubulanus polymorphus TaxID=672921 RepID=UPI003DA32EF0
MIKAVLVLLTLGIVCLLESESLDFLSSDKCNELFPDETHLNAATGKHEIFVKEGCKTCVCESDKQMGVCNSCSPDVSQHGYANPCENAEFYHGLFQTRCHQVGQYVVKDTSETCCKQQTVCEVGSYQQYFDQNKFNEVQKTLEESTAACQNLH